MEWSHPLRLVVALGLGILVGLERESARLEHRKLVFGGVRTHPLISLFGLSLASLLSGSILIEVVFSWPGLGPLLLEAILARDLHLVVGAVVVSTLFLVGGNLLADVLLYTVDPRIRAGSRS